MWCVVWGDSCEYTGNSTVDTSLAIHHLFTDPDVSAQRLSGFLLIKHDGE